MRETNELTNYVLLAQEVRATKPTADVFRYLPDVPRAWLDDAAIPADPALLVCRSGSFAFRITVT